MSSISAPALQSDITVGRANATPLALSYHADRGALLRGPRRGGPRRGEPRVAVERAASEKQVPALLDARHRVLTSGRWGFGKASQPATGNGYGAGHLPQGGVLPWSPTRTFALTCVVATLLASAPASARSQPTTTVAALPDLTQSYNQFEGADLLARGLTFAEMVGRFVPQAVVPNVIKALGGTANCAQRRDVLGWRLYVQRGDASAVGLVAAVSKARVKDFSMWAECGGEVVGGGPGEAISLCVNQLEDADFWYFYGGTKQSVCADFKQALLTRRLSPTAAPSPAPPAPVPTGPVTVKATDGSAAVAECARVEQTGPYGRVARNVIWVRQATFLSAGGVALQATYEPDLLQWNPGAQSWQPTGWRAQPQPSEMRIFADMPPGRYAVRITYRLVDAATGQPMAPQAFILNEYATPNGLVTGGCQF